MEFTHVSRWSHVMADAFGSMTSGGYLNQGVTIGLNFYMPDEDGVAGHLATPAGQDFFRMVFYYSSPAELQGAQDLWIMHRTDKEKLDQAGLFCLRAGHAPGAADSPAPAGRALSQQCAVV